MFMNKRKRGIIFIIFGTLFLLNLIPAYARKGDILIGAFYMPGWKADSPFWGDLRGEPDSRSPGIPWPERKPLLGYYPEGEDWVTKKHIAWASEAGIDFFVYNWYWLPKRGPYIEHALQSFLRLNDKRNFRFAIMWVNHPPFHKSAREWKQVTSYWKKNLFSSKYYLRIKGKPLVLIFSPRKFRKELGSTEKAAYILRKMREAAGGFFLVACLNRPANYEKLGLLVLEGYDGVSAYNYVGYSGPQIDTYDHLIAFYYKTWEDYARKITQINYYLAGKRAPEVEHILAVLKKDHHKRKFVKAFESLKGSGKKLSYLVPVIPGWDERPWKGKDAYVRVRSTPKKFAEMLKKAKFFTNKYQKDRIIEPIILIEAWNEFGEGAYIEPTEGWGKAYLDAVKKALE